MFVMALVGCGMEFGMVIYLLVVIFVFVGGLLNGGLFVLC